MATISKVLRGESVFSTDKHSFASSFSTNKNKQNTRKERDVQWFLLQKI